MKRYELIAIIGILGALTFAGCGGGGGGGGNGKEVTKLYLFGTMSTNSKVAALTSSINIPTFVDYSAFPTRTSPGIYVVRNGVLTASGPIGATSVSGSYDNVTKTLTISLLNNTPTGGFVNMSSSTTRNAGKGTEIATLTTTPGTVFPVGPTTAVVKKYRNLNLDDYTGFYVNYAP